MFVNPCEIDKLILNASTFVFEPKRFDKKCVILKAVFDCVIHLPSFMDLVITFVIMYPIPTEKYDFFLFLA